MWRFIIAVLCLLIEFSVSARDLNRQNYLIGERASGIGGAIVALDGDPEASYYNPAGLATIMRQGISLSASAYQAAFEKYGAIMDIPVGDGDRLTANMRSNAFSTFPQSLMYVLPVGSNDIDAATHHVLALSLIIPDYDKVSGSITQPIENYAFEMKGSFFWEEKTFWFGPSYAIAIGPRLRLGVSIFGLAHQFERRVNLGVKLTTATTLINYYSTVSSEDEGFGFTWLFQVGAQFQLDDRWTIGLVVRSPTLGSIYSNMRMLRLASYYAEDQNGNPVASPQEPGYVDRIETTNVSMDFRLPAMIAVGTSYQIPDLLAVGFDLTFHFPQGTYSLFSGPTIYPQDPQGQNIIDESRALDPSEEHRARWIINVNTGAEVHLFTNWRLRAGFFTDFSVVDNAFYAQSKETRTASIGNPNLVRLGSSLGVSRFSEHATTSVNLVYTCGWGNNWGLNESFGYDPNRVSVTAHTVTLVIAGTANF